MSLSPGTRLGPYEITAAIGAGGMGDVYAAHDARLQRTVAIKVCREEFSARFEREARAIAALNHHNICTLYDVGPNYLVMEMVDGPTLPEIIAARVVSLDEVAETRARVHHLPLPTNGHRQKFGNDPEKHRDFSAVTHGAANKGIPPFLILHIAGNPDTTAQTRRLAAVLQGAGISAKVVGRDTTHEGLNDEIGEPNDPVTKEVFAFVAVALKR